MYLVEHFICLILLPVYEIGSIDFAFIHRSLGELRLFPVKIFESQMFKQAKK